MDQKDGTAITQKSFQQHLALENLVHTSRSALNENETAATTPSTSCSTSASDSSAISGLALAERRYSGGSCDICGYKPKTTNKSRELWDHMATKHYYRARIEEDLKLIKTSAYAQVYGCPICDYTGKDKQSLYRH